VNEGPPRRIASERTSGSVGVWMLMLAGLLGATALGQEAGAGRSDGSPVVCCAADFTLENILAQVKLPAARRGQMQLITVRSKNTRELWPLAGGDSAEFHLRKLAQELVPEAGAFCEIFQTAQGAEARVWDPGSGRYETKVVWRRPIGRPPSERNSRLRLLVRGLSSGGALSGRCAWYSSQGAAERDGRAILRGGGRVLAQSRGGRSLG